MNDNVFKLLVIFFLLHRAGPEAGSAPSIIAKTTLVFVIPFLLFSHLGGVLADRVSKRKIIVSMKLVELLVMMLGCGAVVAGSAHLVYGVMFLMATQSAIFGPSKYGIIPELVGYHRLSRANGVLVGLSYLAIILGTFIPSAYFGFFASDGYLGLTGVCVFLAFCGFLASTKIPVTPAAGSTKKASPVFVAEVVRILRRAAADRYLLLAILASAYFLFVAGYVQQNIILYAREVLGWEWESAGFLFPLVALGIGWGAVTCGRASGRNIEIGLVPLGALGLTVSCVLLSVATSFPFVCILLVVLGVSAGFFIVPLNAFIQYRAPREQLGEILAVNSILSFLGVAISAGAIALLSALPGFTSSTGFLVAGLLTLGLTVAVLKLLPDFFVRLIGVLITRFCYRIRAFGLENVPMGGPALLIPNHVTWVDAVIIMATQQRRIRFLMYRPSYENRWFKPLYDLMQIIPIASADSPRQMLRSLEGARKALDDGYLVCIFAEGALTHNGNMRGFRSGFERIVRGTDVPIIPVHVGGGWGSVFSYYHGKPLTSLKPRKFPYPVTVNFGSPMSPDSYPFEVRQRIQELAGETVINMKSSRRTLPRLFIRCARRNWRRPAMTDTTGKSLTYGKALISTLVMARAIRAETTDEQTVGVLLPSSVGGALVNLALAMLGKVSVNLNFTASRQAMRSAIQQSGVKSIISSKAFLDKLEGFEPPDGILLLEDIQSRITNGMKLKAILFALFAPAYQLLGRRELQPDDMATIIFSSGSTAEPKGIMLSQSNIVSNVEAFSEPLHFGFEDRMCASLPFFHSFGYTVTLWCPLICGFPVDYHPNPVDGAKIAEIVRENKSTILLSTPTFLMAYIRRAKREDFESLRFVITGAEKLKTRIADAFEKQFGMRPLEGYGTTELSPAVSVNLPNVSGDGLEQVGTKEGSIGHPIPGVAMRITDVDSGAPLPPGQEGLVHVKGPNVMLGYIGQPEMTAEVIKDGWYNTGDIGRIDEDGFVTLVDRLSRFSKIAGEMVPHLAIEEIYHEALGATEQVLVVASVPDEKKGEKLVVLYTSQAGDAETLHRAMGAVDVPNLWKPRLESYVAIESIPVLGSGKLDLKGIKEMAFAMTSHTSGGGEASR